MSKKTAQENQQKKQQAQQAQQQNQQTVQSGLTGMQRAAANNYTGSIAPLTYEQFQQARQNGVSMDDLNIYRGIDGSHELTYDEFRVARQLGVSTDALSQYRDQVNARKKAEQQAMAPRGAGQGAVVGASPVWQRPASRAGQGLIAGAQGGDLLHAARQGAAEEASKAHGSALLDYLGSVARLAQDAQGGIMRSPAEQQAQNQRIIDAADQVRQTRDALNRERQPIEWQGRQELIDEYKRLRAALTYTDPEYMTPQEYDQQVKTYSRIQEIERQLTEGDRRAGNGDRVYSFGHGAENVGKALAGGYFEGFVDYGALKLNQALSGVNTNEYAGWATDPMSAEQIGFEHDQSKMGDYAAIQNAANALQQAGGELRASGQEALGRVMEGKSKAAQFGWNLAINMGQMMLDRIVGAVAGVDPLVPMYIRSAGSSARDAMEEGYGVDQQAVYGTVKGLIEVLTEKAGGLGSGIFYGKGWTDALADELVTRLAKNPAAMMGLRVLFAGFEEGAEEGASYGLDPLARWLAGMKQPGLNMADAMEDMLSGFAMGVLGAGGQALTGGYNAENYQTMLEQASRQATQDWYQSGGWLADRETQQEAGREAVYGQDYVERMQQLQAAMQPEQEYYGEETAPQPAAQTAPLAQGSQEQAGQTVQQGAQQAAPAQTQTVAQEEETKKHARTETMTGILQRETTRQGMRNPGTQVLGEMAKVYEPGTSGQAYARAALEAYQAGLDGQSYADARAQAQKAATLSAEQFRTAWQQGQKERARQTKSETQEVQAAGQAEDVETMLAGLGNQAAEAAQAIEEGQDPGDYAAAMQEAVTVYAAAGADLRGAVAQARSGESESVLGVLTDSQVELAERLGQQRQAAFREQARQRGEQRRTRSREQQIRQLQQQRQDLLSKQYGDELSDEEVDRQMEADSQEYERLSEQIRRLESGARVPGSTQRQEGRASYTDKAGSVDGARYVPVDQESLSKAQKATAKVAEAIARTTGLEIRLVRFTGNVGGAYLRGQGGVIYLDPTASYGGRSVAVGSFCHELTHWLQEYAPEEYQQLKEVVLREIGRNPAAFRDIFNERRRAQTDLSPDALTDEMVANACQTILMDQEAVRRVAQENRTLFERIRDFILDMAEQFRAAFAEIDTAGDFPLYKEVRAAQGAMDEMRQIWLNAFDVASENLQAERAEGQNETAAQESDGAQKQAWSEGDAPRAQEAENPEDTIREVQAKNGSTTAIFGSGSAMFSLGTYDSDGRRKLDEYLRKQVKSKALSKDDADQIRTELETLYEICKGMDTGEYEPFSTWSHAKVIEVGGKPVFSVVKANGEYKMNLDNSLVCKKRRTLDAVFNEMIRRGIIDDFALGPGSIAKINEIIKAHGFEVACGLCFVDAKRYRQAMVADAFVQMYNEQVMSLTDGREGLLVDAFNYGGNQMLENSGTGIDTQPASALNWTEIDRILKTEDDTTVKWKIANHLKKHPADRKMVMRGDFMSTRGFDAVAIHNPEMLKLYNAKKGAGGPKAAQSDVQYLNELLAPRKFSVKNAYAVGGVRIQSFSDYVCRLVFDYCQMVADLSAKQLPAHAYTKEYFFAMQFGLTGIKINMSLVPEVVEGGVAPGLDADGNYTWKDGQSFGSTVYDNKGKRMTAAEGFELAKRIQNAKGYSRNCGTIAVGVSDAHIRKMLDDPDIRMVIPYHKSGLNHLVAAMNQIDKYTDYTDQQNTRVMQDGKLKKIETADFNWNDALQKAQARGEGAREAANEYLAWCRARGYTPKFDQFAGHPNYYKLLEDFTSYDSDGTTSTPLGAVQMRFPTADDAFGSMKELIRAGLEEDAMLQAKQEGGVGSIVDEIQAVLPGWEEEHGGGQFQTWDEQHNDWAPTFYSKMAETVSEWTNGKGQKLPPKMAAGQVVGWLKGKGVKSEEIRWSGIVPWLEGRKTVTQAELQQVMAENQVQIETARLVDSGKEMFIGRYDYDDIELHSRDEVRKAAEQIAVEQGFDPSLLEEHENSMWIEYSRADNNEIVVQFKKESEDDRTHWKEYSLPGGSNYREILFKMPSLSGYTNRAMQVHWGERDVIAHARVQDMTGSGGRRVLFIEEIQSDLHNEGAKGGFESETSAARVERISKAKAKVDSLEGGYTSAMKESSDLAHELLDAWKESGSKDAGRATIATVRAWINGHGRFPTVPRTEENDLRADQMLDAMKVEDRLLGSWFLDPMWDQIVSIRNRVQAYDNAVQEYEVSQKRAANVVPDVPFAGESDTYHEYVMKHLLRMAAEGDYDTIAWTTAQMQSDRWSDEYTEGYRIEYDQKIPKFMRKYVKQWGADVSTIQVGETGQEAWAVDLTLAMKASVLNEGQPLFQRWDDPSDDSRAEARGRELGYARLQSENQVLTEAVQALQKLTGKQATTIARLQERLSLTKTPEVRDSDARKLARRLLQEYQSRADAESVQSQLKAIGGYLLQTRTDQIDQGRLKDMARGVAQEILADSYEQIGLEDDVPARVKADLKGRKISIDQDFLGELEGGYEAFRRSVFGTFTLAQRESRSREGREGYITVSQLYADLQGEYGSGILPDVANEGEELMVLRRVMQAAGIEVNPYRQYMGEAAEDMANRIVMDAMDGVLRPRPSTDMDRQQARQQALREQILELRQQQKLSDREAASLYHTIYDLTTALDKAQSRYTTLRTEAAFRQAQLLDEGRAREAERLARVRAQRDEKIAGLKTYYQDMIRRAQDKRTESAGVKKYRKQVAEKTAKLYELLMTNSDAKHVPQALKKPLAEFLESIDFSSKRLLEGGEETKADLKFGARLQALEQLLTNQQRALEGENVEPTDLGGYLDISEENLEYLREISQTVTQALSAGQTYTINQMTAQDLQNLSKLLSNLTKAIRGMNQFLANARFQSVQEAASRDIETMGQLGKARETDHGGVSRFLTWENGIPYYIFKRFGEGGRAIFDGFTRGWEKMAMNAKEIIDFTERTYKSEEVRDWEKTVHDIELEDGSKIRMTTAQIMELSMLLGREQAMKHIEAGGIRIGDIETKKGKISDTAHYHLTANDIDTLLNTLTDRQLEVAKAMQAYMALRGAEWGNEVSMARFGYQFYEEGPGYYPIKTDSNDRPMADTDAQMNSMFRLLNLSASKTLNPKASNALVVGSIFDTFSEHMADMAKLNGMGLPILDAIKWFNYKERINRDDGTYDTRTLQGAMEQAYGSQAQKYFRTLMRDINGQTESGDRGMGAFGGFLSRYKIAAVGANLRVALLQPTSYVRAQTVIKPKYLLAAFTSKNAYKEAMEYSGTAVWKSLGYYDTDISKSMRSQIKHDETALDDLTEKSMWLAEKGDQRTWGRLWVACKMQVKAEQKLEGEALKKATADLFREVIYSSQVMDGTLTRSEIMRAKGIQTKAASAFMAEPTLSYNIVLDAVSDIDQAGRRSGEKTFLGRFKAGWKAAGGKLGRAVITYVSSAAFSAIVESIADAVRDEDDDKFLDKFLEAFLGDDKKLSYSGNLLSDLTLLGKLPFYKEFVSMIQGFQSGNMGFEGFSNAINAYRIWKETYQLATGELEKPTKLTNYGKMTPWGKIYKSLQAVSQLSGIPAANLTRDVVAIWNNTAGAIDPAWKIRRYDNEKARNAENLMRALDSGNRAEIEAAKSAYADENDAISAAKSGVKEDFLNGAMTEEDAARMLTLAGMDKNDAFFTVSGWTTGDSSRYAASKRAAFAGDTAAYRDAMKDMTSHGYTEKQVQSEVKKLVRKVYFGEELSEEELEITGGAKLSDADARKLLHNYAGLSVDESNKLVAEWHESRAFETAHGAEYEKYDLTQSQAKYYYDTVKGSVGMEAYANQVNKYGMDVVKAYYGADGWKQTGLSVEVYSDYRTKASACKGTDADNDGKTDSGSVKAQVLLVIDALPVSASVKDAIYLKNGWAESGLKDAPWH